MGEMDMYDARMVWMSGVGSIEVDWTGLGGE
jgi:hypothetical protein